jgi:hypothetical protein
MNVATFTRPGAQRLVRREAGRDQRTELAVGREARDVPELRGVGAEEEGDAAVVERLDEAAAQRDELLPLRARRGRAREELVLGGAPRGRLLRDPVRELRERRQRRTGRVAGVVVEEDLRRHHRDPGRLDPLDDRAKRDWSSCRTMPSPKKPFACGVSGAGPRTSPRRSRRGGRWWSTSR